MPRRKTNDTRSSILSALVYIHNPMPKTTNGEVLEAIDHFDERMDSDEMTFLMSIAWAPGDPKQRHTLYLEPGQTISLRPEEGAIVLGRWEELGAVQTAGPEPTVDEKLRGLRKGKGFYNERGIKQLNKLRQRHSLTDEQVRIEKPSHAPYYFNVERERLVDEEIKRLAQEKRAKKTTA